MKTSTQIAADIERRLKNTWLDTITAEAGLLTSPGKPFWPHKFPTQAPDRTELEARGIPAYAPTNTELRSFATAHRLEPISAGRRVHGTHQRFITHICVHTIDLAAQAAAGRWPERIATARARIGALSGRFGHDRLPRDVIRHVTGETFTDLDLEILIRVATWFATHDATGLTPRQVPIEGVHAKWLNTHQRQVASLAGVTDLGLRRAHPRRIHYTYLDPTHLNSGGRRHDVATESDPGATPAYKPTLVIICENKDTAVSFPPLEGAIAVEGAGRGAALFAQIDWITQARRLVYWGDLDCDGLEILNEFRDAGVHATSIMTDLETWNTYQAYAVATDARQQPLKSRPPRDLQHLTGPELELYHYLCTRESPAPSRLEQERIPYEAALTALQAVQTSP